MPPKPSIFKTCNVCNEVKSARKNFPLSRHYEGGFAPICRECREAKRQAKRGAYAPLTEALKSWR